MSFLVKQVSWDDCGSVLLKIRRTVFVDEQKVPIEMEKDGNDPDCAHVVCYVKNVAVGTGRLLSDGHIGRIAVLSAYRNLGIGRAITIKLIEIGKECGHRKIELSSQINAELFYEKLGFIRVGTPYMEAGIEHIQMRLTII